MSQKSTRKDDAPESEQGEPASSDTMLIHGISEDGKELAVLRARENRLEAGVVRQLKEGEALMGELVRLTPRPEQPLVCDVTVELPSPVAGAAQKSAQTNRQLSHGGPAQVATESYRANWDAIWSKSKKRAELN